MIIDIKNRILEEGILDGFKSKTGLGIAGLGGAFAGAKIAKDYNNSGSNSVGSYLGSKFGDAKKGVDSFKKDFDSSSVTDNIGKAADTAKNHISDAVSSYSDNI